MKTSKGFLNFGWVPMLESSGMGSALAAFTFRAASKADRVNCRDARFGTWRIVAGKRISRIESRRHGTPTGRCSVGRWVIEWKGSTPSAPRDWTQFGDFASWFVTVSPDERNGYQWTGNVKNDFNLCGTKPNAGRGRKLRRIPRKADIIDAPANGRHVGEHSTEDVPYSPKRAKPKASGRNAPNRPRALAKANRRDTRNKGRTMVSGTYAAAADKTRESIADHAARCRLAARLEAAQK